MIKGVNKNVIEVSDTGNECFERAILFVRPDSAGYNENQIRRRAVDYLSGVKMRPWHHPKGRRVLQVLGWLLSASTGAIVTALYFLI